MPTSPDLSSSIRPQFVRLSEVERPVVNFYLDGEPTEALCGDTVLTAILCNASMLRQSEFNDGPRAGFCNMGACQDCWIDFDNGKRARACTTRVEDGMHVRTGKPPP